MEPALVSAVQHHVFPLLQLADLQALRWTCTALATALERAPLDIWTSAARRTLPDSHPLCTGTSAASIVQQGNQLAKMHGALRTSSGLGITPIVLQSRGLAPTINHQGTLIVTELSSQLHLHELQLTPELGLHKVASLPCPELGCKPGQLQQQSAAWAPDDSALLLRYHVTDQADSRGSFEVVYLLDAEAASTRPDAAVTFIALFRTAYRHVFDVTFSPSSGLIVAVLREPRISGEDSAVHVHVFDRGGQALATFHDQHAMRWPSLAYTKMDTVAIAHEAPEFAAWDLQSGQLMGTRAPVLDATVSGHKFIDQQVVCNTDRSRLALATINGSAIYLYDAVTLLQLATVLLARNLMFGALGLMVYRIRWLPFGWLLLLDDGRIQLFRPQPGSYLATGVLSCKAWPLYQPRCRPAVSPDGALLCTLELGSDSLSVHDTRTGQLVLRQPLNQPRQAHRKCRVSSRSVVVWSSCGGRVCIKDPAWHVGVRMGHKYILTLQLQ